VVWLSAGEALLRYPEVGGIVKILSNEFYPEFLDYIHKLRASLPEWLLVNLTIAPNSDKDLTITNIANLLHAGLIHHDGVIYVCNTSELLVVIRWGSTPRAMTECSVAIEKFLPEQSCQMRVEKSTPEGLRKIVISVSYTRPDIAESMIEQRRARKTNVFLVVDDDAFQRMLLRKGLSGIGEVVEVDDGNLVMTAYKKANPDIVFLDIHLPNQSGRDIVHHLTMYDPEACVIMISADASQENIADTWQKGAQNFLSKPFTKERLMQCVRECTTVSAD